MPCNQPKIQGSWKICMTRVMWNSPERGNPAPRRLVNSTNQNSFQEACSMGSRAPRQGGHHLLCLWAGTGQSLAAWVSDLREANIVKSWRLRSVYMTDKQVFAPFYILYMSKLPGAWLRWVTFIFRDYYLSSSSASSSKPAAMTGAWHDLPNEARAESEDKGSNKSDKPQV